MRVVIAPDSFKGSLTALQAAEAMAAGVRRIWPDAEIASIPLADGGEGFVDAWLRARGGRREARTVTGPLGDPVSAMFGVLSPASPRTSRRIGETGEPATAIVESASACGLTLTPLGLRNPLQTTTYGVGELIREASLAIGCGRVIVGLGGTATNDGGAGALQALGVRFFDHAGNLLSAPLTGGILRQIARLDPQDFTRSELARTTIILASDVMNPLIGPNGASAIYGPQKGATPQMVDLLNDSLAHFAQIIRRDIGPDIAALPGAGAAGGLGGGLMALFGAKAQSGIDLILDAAGFNALAAGAAWVITGEGSIDRQTLSGKAVMGVVNRCRRLQMPVIAIGGLVDRDTTSDLLQSGVTAIEAAKPDAMPVHEAMGRAPELVADATARAVAAIGERQ